MREEGEVVAEPGSPARGPMGIGEALDEGLRLYRRAFLPILGLSALFVAPYTVASLFINTARTGELLLRPLLRTPGRQVAPLSPEALLGFSILAMFGALVLGPLVYCAVVRVADQAWRGEAPAAGRALVWSLRRLFALFVTGFLVLLAGTVLTVMAVFLATMAMGLGVLAIEGGNVVTPGAASLVVAGVTALGLMLLVSAAWLLFFFVPQSIVLESRGYFRAIGRSMALVWSHIFRTQALFWSALLLIAALSLVVLLPELLWTTIVGETGAGVVGKLAQGVVSLLTFPLLPLVTTVAYHDLRLRHEGFDLEDRLRRLEGEA